jgi:type IV pilus assembly protein PilB
MTGRFDKRIRNLLVKYELVPEAKADEALALATKENKSYTDVLLEKNIIDEISLIAGIAQETNLPPLDLTKVEFEEDALKILSQEMATHYVVLPVSKIGTIVTLAVGNPFDILKLDDLRTLTNCELRPIVSTERTIRAVIPKAYNPGHKEMEQFMDTMANPAVELKEDAEEEEIDVSTLKDDASDSPVIKLVNLTIAQAIKESASDIHIEPFEKTTRVRFRGDGVLRETLSPPKKLHNALISRIKIMAGLDIAERRIPQDGKFQMKIDGRQVDFRVSILPSIHGEKVVMRILDSTGLARSLEALGFEPQALGAFQRAVNASYGMVLVTGPTGSGKSTTLYSAVKEVLCVEDNIVTVEDPVEYQLEGVIQVPVNVKRGLTFAAALRSILRQDPDTVMIGEIRDAETADIAVKAAITGHLVFSTLHTNDSASSITRLIDMGIDSFMVSSSVLLVSAQRLLRKLCESCKAPSDSVPPKEHLLEIGFLPQEINGMKLLKPVGCPRCSNGYKGRFAILEALVVDDSIRRMIIEKKSAMDLKAQAIKRGMLTLRRTALLNAMRGKTSLEEVLRMTMND